MDKEKLKRQIPNIITSSRVLLMIPTLASFFTGNILLATGIFSVAAATDGIDGYIARKNNWTSTFGAHLDAFCDKLYVGLGSIMPIVSSGYKYLIPVVMEAVISGYNMYREYAKKQEVKSTKMGKLKTCLLFPTLVLGMCAPKLGISDTIVNSALYVTFAAQTATLYSYHKDSKQQEKQKNEEKINSDKKENIELEQKQDFNEENVKPMVRVRE